MSELVVIREMQEKDILALDTQFVQQGWPSRQEICSGEKGNAVRLCDVTAIS